MAVVYRKDADTTPHSRQQITTLKHKTLQMESGARSVKRGVMAAIMDIASLFTLKLGTSHRQCKLYGHILPGSGWVSGRHPACAECGKKIKSPNELRKPTL